MNTDKYDRVNESFNTSFKDTSKTLDLSLRENIKLNTVDKFSGGG